MSIQRASLASSLIDEELTATLVERQSPDPAERGRASDIRLLLKRSVALARAAADPNLDIAVGTAARNPHSPLFVGALRSQQSKRQRQRCTGTAQPRSRSELEGGLPTLALRAEGNKEAAARAFLTLSNVDGSMREEPEGWSGLNPAVRLLHPFADRGSAS